LRNERRERTANEGAKKEKGKKKRGEISAKGADLVNII